MSHFTTLVIMSKEDYKADKDETIKRLLAPYDENMETEPYMKKCYCIGQVARNECEEKADKKFGTIKERRDRFNKETEIITAKMDGLDNKSKEYEKLDSKLDAIWKGKYIKPRQEYVNQLFEKHPDKDKPDPTCGFYSERFHPNGEDTIGQRFEDNSGCGATGEYESTYNPKSKWDWYKVGGRWNNELPNGKNEISMEKIKDFESFAFVTPDGIWHQKGDMGWWAMVVNEKEEGIWKKEVKAIKSQYGKGYYGILVDCHI